MGALGDISNDTGRFEAAELVGSGAMGQVFRAKDRLTGVTVALKIASSHEHSGRFLEEAAALGRIDHPGVVRYVAHGLREDGTAFLAMDWVEGKTLNDVLRGGPLSVERTLALGVRIARALGAAHRAGVVHRDVKPGNVMLPSEDFDSAIVVDFGLARRPGQQLAELTRSGTLIGTPAYMAPEQARGQRDLDARVDVFALGCVLFRCLTGKPAFSGDGVMAVLAKLLLEPTPRARDLEPSIPRWLDAVIARLMASDVEHRPRDGDMVADILQKTSRAEPDVPSEAALTTSERRFVSVIVVPPSEAPPSPDVNGDETSSIAVDAMHVFAQHGARVERLLNGTVIGLLTDQAAEHGIRAARCALGLRHAFGKARIGFATGRAELTQRSPVGEVIEAAAALSSPGEPGVWVDAATRELLERRFDVSEAGLLSRELPPQLAARKLLGKVTPCVGRDHELLSLASFVSRAFSDGAGAMLVTSHAGYGKSRLRYELLQRVESEHPSCEVWLARGDVMGYGSPYNLASQIIVSAIGLSPSESDDARRRKITERIGVLGLPALTSRFLCEMLGCAAFEDQGPEVDLARRDARLMRDRVRAAFVAWAVAESKLRPILVAIEDLHWGDQPSVGLIDALLDPDLLATLAVVAFARPEVHTALPGLWSERTTSELRLGPLGKRPARQLARAVLGADVSEEVIERVVDTAAGNAFYLEELLRVTAAGSRDELPNTVLAMSESRLERLTPERRRLLRAASILGQAFWPSALALLTGMTSDEISAHLSALTADELVNTTSEARFTNEPQLIFRHSLVREAAYATLTDDDRKLGHGLAAQWLEQHGEHDHRVLVEHYERSANAAPAIPHVVRLAEQALEAGDWNAAATRAEQARGLGATGVELGRAMVVVAEMAMWQGQRGNDPAELAVASFLEGSPEWCRAVSIAGVHATRTGRYETHTRLRERMLAITHGEISPDLLAALAHLAFAATSANQPNDELIARLESYRDASRSMSPWVRARVEHALYIRYTRSVVGIADEDFVRLDAVVGELEALGDERGSIYFRNNLGYGRILACKLDAGERDMNRVAASAKALSLPHMFNSAVRGRAVIAFLRGRLAESRAFFDEALSHGLQDVRIRASIQAQLARVCFAQGAMEDADGYATLAEGGGVLLDAVAVGLCVRARVALARGDTQEAIALVRRSKAVADSAELDILDSTTVRGALVDVLLAADLEAEAYAEVETAYDALMTWGQHITDWPQSILDHPEYSPIVAHHARSKRQGPRA